MLSANIGSEAVRTPEWSTIIPNKLIPVTFEKWHNAARRRGLCDESLRSD